MKRVSLVGAALLFALFALPAHAQTPAPAASVAPAPSPTPVPTPPHFVGSAILGYTAASGNTTDSALSVAVHAVRDTGVNKFSFYAATLNATGNGAVTASQAGAGLRYDVNLSKKTFTFVSGDFLHNGLQHLNFGQLYGLGYGVHVIEEKAQTFDVFGGVGYTDNRFGSFLNTANVLVPQMSFTAPSALVGENYTRQLSPGSSLIEGLEYFPRLNGTGQSVANFNLGLSSSISKSLSLNLGLADQYTAEVTAPIKPNNLLITTGLGFKFGS